MNSSSFAPYTIPSSSGPSTWGPCISCHCFLVKSLRKCRIRRMIVDNRRQVGYTAPRRPARDPARATPPPSTYIGRKYPRGGRSLSKQVAIEVHGSKCIYFWRKMRAGGGKGVKVVVLHFARALCEPSDELSDSTAPGGDELSMSYWTNDCIV